MHDNTLLLQVVWLSGLGTPLWRSFELASNSFVQNVCRQSKVSYLSEPVLRDACLNHRSHWT